MARRSSSMTMGFPPFTYAVKWLVIINCAIYVLVLLLSGLNVASSGTIDHFFGLIPDAVVHGQIWQVVTYSFIHAGLFHLLFNMLTLWMFGSQFEMDWGRRQFLEFYFFCVVGAAITSIVVGYGGLLAYHFWDAPLLRSMASLTLIPTVGASGGIFGILLAYGMIYGNREILLWFVHMRIWTSHEMRNEAMQDPDVHKFWMRLPEVCTLTTIYEDLEELYSSYEPVASVNKAQ